MKLLLPALFCMFVVMQYMYLFGESGFLATRLLVQDVKAQAEFNQRLAERNELLRMEIQRIKHDKSVIESIARNDLGMIKPNETFYLYVGDS